MRVTFSSTCKYFIMGWEHALAWSRRMPDTDANEILSHTVCVVDVLGPQVCFAAWPNYFKRLWIKSFLHICWLTAPQIGTKSQNKWRIMTFSLCINIFWICVCVVSSEARVLVRVLENPRPPPGCRRIWAVCWILPTLLSWIMLLLQSLSEMKQHLYQNIRAFCSAQRRLFSNLIALLARNSLLISSLRLLAKKWFVSTWVLYQLYPFVSRRLLITFFAYLPILKNRSHSFWAFLATASLVLYAIFCLAPGKIIL